MKILLLEDDYNYKESIKELLLSLGYEVDDFLSGDEALEAAFHNSYDLLLLDIRVPGIDGYGIVKEVRSYGLKVPVIFITSLTDVNNLSLGYELGCNDYIRKPFSLKELKYRIEEAIRSYHFHSVSPQVQLPCGFIFEIHSGTLRHEDHEIALSDKERRVIGLLVKNLDTFMDVDTIREYAWEGKEVGDNDIRMVIKKIRSKTSKEFIQSQRGVGYKIAKE